MKKLITVTTTITIFFFLFINSYACGKNGKNVVQNSNNMLQGQSLDLNINSKSEGTDIPPDIPEFFPGPGPRGVSPSPNVLNFPQSYNIEGKVISVYPMGTKAFPVGYGYYFICVPRGLMPAHLMGFFTEKARREGVFTPPESVDVLFSRVVHKAARDYEGKNLILLMQDTPRPQLVGKGLGIPGVATTPDREMVGGGVIGKHLSIEERVSWLTCFVFKVLGPPLRCKTPNNCEKIKEHIKMLLSLRCSHLSILNGEIWKEVGLDKIRLYFCTGEAFLLREAWLALNQAQRNFRAINYKDYRELSLLIGFTKNRANEKEVRDIIKKKMKPREYFLNLPKMKPKKKSTTAPKRRNKKHHKNNPKHRKVLINKATKEKDPLEDLKDFVIYGPFNCN